MSLETFLSIVSFVALVVCYIGYRYCSVNVYLRYKEQKVGGCTKRCKGNKQKRKAASGGRSPEDGKHKFMQCYCSTEKELNQ